MKQKRTELHISKEARANIIASKDSNEIVRTSCTYSVHIFAEHINGGEGEEGKFPNYFSRTCCIQLSAARTHARTHGHRSQSARACTYHGVCHKVSRYLGQTFFLCSIRRVAVEKRILHKKKSSFSFLPGIIFLKIVFQGISSLLLLSLIIVITTTLCVSYLV